MPYNNNINYAAVFNRILDEKFYIMPRTLWMENTSPEIVWTGGREIKIPKMDMNGLGNMQGYKAPDGDLTLSYETKRLQWYRGRNFAIGRYEMDETNMALTVNNAIQTFLRQHVTPETDRLRIATLAQNAVNYGASSVTAQATAGITSANILGLLLDDIAKVQNRIGEDEQLYIQISTTLKNILEQSDKIQKYLNVRDFSIRSATLKMTALNEQFLIGTPSSYMNSVVQVNDGRTDGQTVGGVTFTDLGPGVNWIVSARTVADAVARPQITKVINPDDNQEGEFWKIMFSIYHGMWTMDNKADGVVVNMDPTLATFAVTSVAGTVAVGDSVITAAASFDPTAPLKLVWKAASGDAPAVTFGTALTTANGWADLPADGLISSTNGYKITVALVTRDSLLPLASGTATVVAKAS
jgi:hypothetical protein